MSFVHELPVWRTFFRRETEQIFGEDVRHAVILQHVRRIDSVLLIEQIEWSVLLLGLQVLDEVRKGHVESRACAELANKSASVIISISNTSCIVITNCNKDLSNNNASKLKKFVRRT